MCVIAKATDFDSEEFFEIHELESRESLLLKVCIIMCNQLAIELTELFFIPLYTGRNTIRNA